MLFSVPLFLFFFYKFSCSFFLFASTSSSRKILKLFVDFSCFSGNDSQNLSRFAWLRFRIVNSYHFECRVSGVDNLFDCTTNEISASSSSLFLIRITFFFFCLCMYSVFSSIYLWIIMNFTYNDINIDILFMTTNKFQALRKLRNYIILHILYILFSNFIR